MPKFFILLSILLFSACDFSQDEDFQSNLAAFNNRLQEDTTFQILSASHFETQEQGYTLVQQDLNEYQVNRLNEEHQQQLKALQTTVQHKLWTLQTFKPHQWNPTQYNLMPHFKFIYDDTPPSDKKATQCIARLKQLTAYYEAAKAQIQHPTLFHTQLAIQQQEYAYFFFKNELPKWFDNVTLTEIEKNDFQFHRQKALLSIKDFLGFLNSKINNADDGTPEDTLSTMEEKKKLYSKQFNIEEGTLSDKAFIELLN